MSVPLPHQRRIESLEEQLASLRHLVEQGIGRRGNFGYPVQTRLVQAGPATGETYPADPCNVYPVRFVDTDFLPTDGLQVPTYATRSANVQARVMQLDAEEYIPPGAIYPAFQLQPLSGTAGGKWFSNVQVTQVPFRNESGYSVPAHGCMRVTGWDDTELVYTTDRPHADYFDSLYLINGPTSVAAPAGDPLVYGYSFGRFAHVTGLTIACDSGTPAFNACWGPQPDSFLLKQHAAGFLVARPAASGYLRAFPYPVFDVIGKCAYAISKGSTGDVDIYWGVAGTEVVSGFVLSCRALGAAIVANKWVKCERLNGQWYVGPWECA